MERKTNRLQVLLTEEDRVKLDETARQNELDTSTWARMVLLKQVKEVASKKGKQK